MPLGKAAQRFGALLLLEASLAAQIGVAPEDQENYACHGDPCTFRCLSGQKDTLPLSAINDDFCDCEDGSDEPGTAACAGRGQETLFYCPNAEGIPRLIYTSRVRDGICDCCDGSDELAGDTTPCSNTCSDEGAERERTLERFRRGLEKHKEGRRDAKNSRQRWREEVESLKQQHAKLLKEDGQQTLRQGAMADLQRMKDEIEALKEQIRVLQARQDGMENQVTSSASGREASEESAAVAASAADVPKTQVDDVAKAPEEALPQVSEYAKKWMDNSEAMLETTPSTSQAIEETEVKQAGSEPSTNQTDMKQKLDKTKSRIKELEDKLGFLPEDKLAYFPLLDTCLESDKFNGHTYSICFFRSCAPVWGHTGQRLPGKLRRVERPAADRVQGRQELRQRAATIDGEVQVF
ncbi:unnamed protein product [Effrenium voratum]|nr:unnamed protein product [Effrenium voratum]